MHFQWNSPYLSNLKLLFLSVTGIHFVYVSTITQFLRVTGIHFVYVSTITQFLRVTGIHFVYVSTITQLDFRIVLTLW